MTKKDMINLKCTTDGVVTKDKDKDIAQKDFKEKLKNIADEVIKRNKLDLLKEKDQEIQKLEKLVCEKERERAELDHELDESRKENEQLKKALEILRASNAFYANQESWCSLSELNNIGSVYTIKPVHTEDCMEWGQARQAEAKVKELGL